jgi:hypothetical protein
VRQVQVYVHCTAGLGRAPAACIAYLYWFQGHTLDSAYSHLTRIRPCGPKWESIRGATYDVLVGGDPRGLDGLPGNAFDGMSDEERHRLQGRVFEGEQVPAQPQAV